MWYEIFKFELKYRIRRPETYVFFVFLLLFSLAGTDFVFQGVELGLMKKNAPLVIAKTMGAITGIFMIMVSMIMGVPVLRDYQYDTYALLFVNPISKRDYLLGRFLGSFTILLFVFSGLLIGMMLGSQMPWHKEDQMLAFNAFSYIRAFTVVSLPTLFFGACVFFVTGILSKKLLVVYTQGIVLFVIFLLTKAITNEYLQGIFDPFSLTTLTQYSKDWSVVERNTFEVSFNGILLHNKLVWIVLGLTVLIYGYYKFSFSVLANKPRKRSKKVADIDISNDDSDVVIPEVSLRHDLKSKLTQLFELTKFYMLSLLKETSFWAIVICGIIIIAINSVNLGTVYGVDSYPATYFILAELQEMSMYFFVIILLFYSGEIIWKERRIKQYLLNDATPVSNLMTLGSKFLALTGIYIVLMLSLILAGILFQITSGYYKFDLSVYFTGFFVEILPFLMLYTCVTFFFQVLSNRKFIGILLVLLFFIINIGSEFFGFKHSLYKFGGKSLGTYSEMNGYGHFLAPYLWIKAYWLVFGMLLIIVSALLMVRGTDSSLWERIKSIRQNITRPTVYLSYSLIILFLLIGSYIFYNTNVLNTYWTNDQELVFRLEYEKELKHLEYIPQPKITDVKLNIELYPKSRNYEIVGSYNLKNTTDKPIYEIHIQKLLASHVELNAVEFDVETTVNDKYKAFDYTIFELSKPLQPNRSVRMEFEQTYSPEGFENGNSGTKVVYNGTLFNNTILPSLGYNRKYEISNEDDRIAMSLKSRSRKEKLNDENELKNALSGGDSDGITLDVVIGTSNKQTAITSGKLIDHWSEDNRNYFHYSSTQRIINLYSIVSAEYVVKKDSWISSGTDKSVDLEIYYHHGHEYNLDRMMSGMKASLDYYTRNFTPYQYDHLRIMEFPRYSDYAQSLPNTIPFSEALGFVLNIKDEEDVDMAFYVTAHEVAHQWFGMQVEAANVQGKNFILETLAQYGALMVLKENYSIEKIEQFLEMQEEIYDKERKKAVSEPTLALVEHQDFVYYNKGAITMYKLQQEIGEEQVNKAIQNFINDWRSYTGILKSKTNRYPTSTDLLECFKSVTPAHQQHIIYELFEETS